MTPPRRANDGPPADDRSPSAGDQAPIQPSTGDGPEAGRPQAAGLPPAEIPQAGPPPAASPPRAPESPPAELPHAGLPPAEPAQAADPAGPHSDDSVPPGDPVRPGQSGDAEPEPPGPVGSGDGASDDDGARVGTVISARRPAAVPALPDDAGSGVAEPAREPSWPQVIATTLRLWFQRRGARRPGARRRALVLGVAIIVFVAGGLTFALVEGRGPAAKPRRAAVPALNPGAVAAAAANRQAAATWVAAQVSRSVIVSCDPVMCATLSTDGFPAGDLLPITASATDPLGSAVVVSTTALRSQFGRRLPDVYAPVVLATFGHGGARVDIRVEAPDGGRSYLVSQRADELARQQSGQQLLANKHLRVSAAAGQEIAAGNVDARLLITLAALTFQVHEVDVIAVGDSGPGASAGVPLRMVRISALVSPGHPSRNASYLKAVLAFLKVQQPPYLASVSVLHQGGASIVQLQFAAPSPLGLLGIQAAP